MSNKEARSVPNAQLDFGQNPDMIRLRRGGVDLARVRNTGRLPDGTVKCPVCTYPAFRLERDARGFRYVHPSRRFPCRSTYWSGGLSELVGPDNPSGPSHPKVDASYLLRANSLYAIEGWLR